MARKKHARQKNSGGTDAAATPPTYELAGPVLWPLALIAGATLLTYSNALDCAFVFDDKSDILDNAGLRDLSNWKAVLAASPNRPVVGVTFAINYALSGVNPWSYHLFNVLFHTVSACLLFAILRRTLQRSAPFQSAATWLACGSALLWAVHPLQTQAVTYTVQRYESLMGLFYLLTLYLVLRGAVAPRRHGLWYGAAVCACALGMGCKEVMVTAPLVILLYDRVFLTASWRETLRLRWSVYAALAATWVIPAVLVTSQLSSMSQWGGFGFKEITPWEYFRTQPEVILRLYLRLAFWPSGQVLDYGWPVAKSAAEYVPWASALLGLLVLTGVALWKYPRWGFLGAWFFLILAPTSSIMPIESLAFEHRMYLSLAALVTGVVLVGYTGVRACASRGWIPRSATSILGMGAVVVMAMTLSVQTFLRNKDYASELSIWTDTVGKAPGNSRARHNLGNALGDKSQTDEAIRHYREALRLKPGFPQAHNNLGAALAAKGQTDEAIRHYREALRSKPDFPEAHNNLGNVLAAKSQTDEAIRHYREALRSKPDYPQAYNNLGNALGDKSQTDEAIRYYREALRLKPDYPQAHNNLGQTLAGIGQTDEAIRHYREALRLKPDFPEAHNNLGLALAGIGQTDEAIRHYREALRLKPNDAAAYNNLGVALMVKRDVENAIRQFRQALRIDPNLAHAKKNLEKLNVVGN